MFFWLTDIGHLLLFFAGVLHRLQSTLNLCAPSKHPPSSPAPNNSKRPLRALASARSLHPPQRPQQTPLRVPLRVQEGAAQQGGRGQRGKRGKSREGGKGQEGRKEREREDGAGGKGSEEGEREERENRARRGPGGAGGERGGKRGEEPGERKTGGAGRGEKARKRKIAAGGREKIHEGQEKNPSWPAARRTTTRRARRRRCTGSGGRSLGGYGAGSWGRWIALWCRLFAVVFRPCCGGAQRKDSAAAEACSGAGGWRMSGARLLRVTSGAAAGEVGETGRIFRPFSFNYPALLSNTYCFGLMWQRRSSVLL